MDELLLRQMPHSTEGRAGRLGSMLIDAACVKDVMDQLQPDDFYLRQNREIFETIYTMFVYSRPIDGLTVAGGAGEGGPRQRWHTGVSGPADGGDTHFRQCVGVCASGA